MTTQKSVIYMADDDVDDRFFMRQAIRQVDPSITVVEAEDGSDLLTMLTTWSLTTLVGPVHLILLDMNMPKSNGLETLKALKANPALRHIPTVMISTSADPEAVLTAYKQGINSYIQKPANSFAMGQIAQALKVCFLDTPTGINQ